MVNGKECKPISTSQTTHQNNGTLKYDVLLEQSNGNGYTARLLAWPDTVVEAPTREKALQQLRFMPLGYQNQTNALANHCTVVTRNRRDFERVPGLRVENWSVAEA